MRACCQLKFVKNCTRAATEEWPLRSFKVTNSGSIWHAMINLLIKFEVYSITRYRDMKCVANVTNGVVWGSSGSSKVISNVTIQQTAYDFLFVFIRNYASISYRFRNTSTSTYHTCIWCYHWEWPLSNFKKFFWSQKTRVPGLSYDIVIVILHVAVFVNSDLWQTQTDRHRVMAYTVQSTAHAVMKSFRKGITFRSHRTRFGTQ